MENIFFVVIANKYWLILTSERVIVTHLEFKMIVWYIMLGHSRTNEIYTESMSKSYCYLIRMFFASIRFFDTQISY